MENKPERKYYIDNLRWACILLLIPFHAAMAWNSWGEGNYVWIQGNRFLSSFILLVSPWYMPLMFVIAGISARMAMKRRTFKEFTVERIRKLFLPLAAGLLTIAPIMSYVGDCYNNGYTGNFFSHYYVYFTKITTLNGYDGGFTPAHLWFLLYLFIISMVGLGITALQKKFLPNANFSKIGMAVILLMALTLPVANLLLDIGGKSVGYFLVLYLLGYYLLAEDAVIDRIARYKAVLVFLALVFSTLCAYFYVWMPEPIEVLWKSALFLSCWFGILALLGMGKKYFNQNNRVTRYLSTRSFSVYLFHFVWVIAIQYNATQYISNTAALFLISVIGGFLLTLITCEIAFHTKKIWNIIILKNKHNKSPIPEGRGDIS